MLLKVTFSEEELAAIDRRRGQLPRASWVRQATRQTLGLDGPEARERRAPGQAIPPPIGEGVRRSRPL